MAKAAPTVPAKTVAVKPAPIKKAPSAPAVATKPAAPAKAKPRLAAPASTPAPAKAVKAKKPKLVRDSFTMPKPEYAVLGQLKDRAAALARPAKKSELLRAGVKALAALDDAGFLAAMGAVPTIKTGRPKLTKA